MARPTHADIDLDAVIRNIYEIKHHIGNRKICAAVKADAYGHGAAAVSHALNLAGVDLFGVALTEEAVQLRNAGIKKPIILLAPVPEEDIKTMLEFDISACITSFDFAEKYSEQAVKNNKIARAHINIDTGMGRVGLPHHNAVEDILAVKRLPGLGIEGIFTHLAFSEDEETSNVQLAIFNHILSRLKDAGMKLPMLHAANSAATLQIPEAHMQCIRPGLILYGLYPPNIKPNGVELTPVLTLRSKIAFCKKVPAGTKIGYGHTFTTRRESVIATIPVGYHDGYMRQYSNKGEMIVRGRRVPVVGRVCMDQTLLDVTDVPEARVDDEVVVYGQQGGERIGIEEMAKRIDTIPNEVTCAVGARVRRKYISKGQVVGVTPEGSFVPSGGLSEVVANLYADKRATQRQLAQNGAA